jgi:hypothetical protein
VVQLGKAVWIEAEYDVIAIGISNLATIGYCGEAWVGRIEQEWEVVLVRVLDLRVVDDNCALVAISARSA